MRRNSIFLLTTLLLSSAAAPSFADDIENVVVTATRTEQPIEKTGESLDGIALILQIRGAKKLRQTRVCATAGRKSCVPQ